MEEADALADRIAVVVDGKLKSQKYLWRRIYNQYDL